MFSYIMEYVVHRLPCFPEKASWPRGALWYSGFLEREVAMGQSGAAETIPRQ